MCLNTFLVSTLHDFILCNHSHSVSWTSAKSVSSRYIISNVNTFNKLKFCNFVSFLQLPNNYFISAKSSASPEKWSKGKPEANKARIQGCNIWKLRLKIYDSTILGSFSRGERGCKREHCTFTRWTQVSNPRCIESK